MDVEPCVLDVASDLGAQYIHAVELGGAYAYAGRDWVCSRVAELLGASIVEEVHNHHNYAWRETHGDESYWVDRKGATPAFPGQKRFLAGTMAEPAVILEGVESEEAASSLYSTVHGAGRVMGRREAAGVFDRKTGACKRPGKVTPEMMEQSVARRRWNSGELDWTNHRIATSGSAKYSGPTTTASASCTHLLPLASPWLRPKSSIPTRIDGPLRIRCAVERDIPTSRCKYRRRCRLLPAPSVCWNGYRMISVPSRS